MKREEILSPATLTSPARICILTSKFNYDITNRLLEGAYSCVSTYGYNKIQLSSYWVPGAFELPLAAKKFANLKKFDAIICLGAIIKGETAHFDYISQETAHGIQQVSLAAEIPVIFGVLTTFTKKQAEERSQANQTNKGFEAMTAALEMIELFRKEY